MCMCPFPRSARYQLWPGSFSGQVFGGLSTVLAAWGAGSDLGCGVFCFGWFFCFGIRFSLLIATRRGKGLAKDSPATHSQASAGFSRDFDNSLEHTVMTFPLTVDYLAIPRIRSLKPPVAIAGR